ncbi:MAG: ABC transporter permease [Actinobacteria bacterium]|nr:ABC transporter permease [Actinomycetota bacterium]
MSSYILFLLLGLGSGAIYAILALGLVMKYRSAGVVDFGHSAVAMFIAYVYFGLRTEGKLELPWAILPHEITITGSEMGNAPAMIAALLYAAVLGLVMYLLIYRPLRHATQLARICASVGILLYLQAIAVLDFSSNPKSVPTILPDSPLHFAGVIVPVDRLWFAGLVVVLATALWSTYRFTRFGLATRAASENEEGAAVIGLSADRIAATNWVLATVLAALAGILIAPIATIQPASYTLFIVPALAVALVARFQSFAIAAAAGLILGMLQSEVTKLISVIDWLPKEGLPEAIPFIVIVVGMTLVAKGMRARGEIVVQRNPSLGRPSRPYVTTAFCFAVGAIALVLLQGSLRFALISSFVWICLALSLVVLTGYVGQVSLAQMAFAGVSAFALTHITGQLGIGFPFSFILASLAAVPLGIVIGLPALRLRGVNLAVVTLSAGLVLDSLVFNWTWFTGGLGGTKVGNPSLLGWNLGISSGNAYPRVIFGIFVLAVVCGIGLLVARLRRAPAGRMMIAVRSNERAAAAAGIDVNRTKLLAFALSSWIAGVGGVLFAYTQQTVSPPTFEVFTSLGLVAIAFVAGVGRIGGAVFAGIMMASTGLFVTFLNREFNIGKYQLLVAGLLLTITAIKQPDGVAANPPPPLVHAWKWLEARLFYKSETAQASSTVAASAGSEH